MSVRSIDVITSSLCGALLGGCVAGVVLSGLHFGDWVESHWKYGALCILLTGIATGMWLGARSQHTMERE